MYTLHTHCRACGYAHPGASGIKSDLKEKLIEVVDLGIQPLANDFCVDGEPRDGYAPLKVLFCPRCSLAQLSVVVDPAILYRHYSYVTSPSNMMQEHFRRLMKDIVAETDGKRVLEIGSNDGRLLGMMQAEGYSVTGIDPAMNLAEIANRNGIPTINEFFTAAVAQPLATADIVIARHVFCHADDWKDFVQALEEVSNAETLICIEVPYAGDTLKNCEFDTIYHEHLSYLTIKSVQALLKDSWLHLHRVTWYPIHGGTLLLMLRTNDSVQQPYPETFIQNESITAADWRLLADTAREQIGRLKATVESLVAQKKRVAGLGASAKSTVWITACGFTRKEIAFIADATPQKQYTWSPGTDIPVVDEGAILRDLPDYVVMWAWNYRPEILSKFSLAREKGVRFIVPVPKIEIV